jgi:hypothetical protein
MANQGAAQQKTENQRKSTTHLAESEVIAANHKSSGHVEGTTDYEEGGDYLPRHVRLMFVCLVGRPEKRKRSN